MNKNALLLESLNRKVKALNIDMKTPRRESLKDLVAVEIPDDTMDQARDWCDQHFGDNWIWSRDYRDTLYFKNPEDAVLFKLSNPTL